MDHALNSTELTQERPSGRSAPGQPETENANPESNLGLAGAIAPLALPIIVSSWPKNSRETLLVRIDAFKGQTVIDARAWYGETENLKPGRGGLTVAIRHLPALADAMVKALALAQLRGLVDGQKGGGT